MVTHGIHWLPHVDYIVVMNDGTISESGTYEKLMDHNGAFAQFLTQYLRQEISTAKEEDTEKIGNFVFYLFLASNTFFSWLMSLSCISYLYLTGCCMIFYSSIIHRHPSALYMLMWLTLQTDISCLQK